MPNMWPIQKQKDRAVLTKPKLIVYIGKSQKTAILASKGPKSAKKAPIMVKLKTKDGAVLSHINHAIQVFFQSQLFKDCRCSSHVYFTFSYNSL